MKKKLFRAATLAAAAALSCGALAMFAGCSTKHPEVTITYTFNGQDYAVDYVLSRNDAPQTVQHFIELADAGFYDGLCVHDYDSNFLYTGGYTLTEGGELEEVNYVKVMQELEENGVTFTKSVWLDKDKKTPLYTVYGEFSDNGVATQYSRENRHTKGALVMYYTDKGSFSGDVWVDRADKGKGNDNESVQDVKYATNSATSLFYTCTSPDNNYILENSYCVFGMAKKYDDQLENGLLKAIDDYIDEYISGTDGASFTEEITEKLNRYEPFEDLSKGDAEATFDTPVRAPIIVKSVKVTKY